MTTPNTASEAEKPTPSISRTDTLISKLKYDDIQGATSCLVILAEHANQLEQELIAAHGRGYGDDAFIQVQAEKIAQLEQQLAAQTDLNAKLTAERDYYKAKWDDVELHMALTYSALTQAQQRVTELTARVAELEETLKAVRAVNVNEFGHVADLAIERLIASSPTPQQPTAPETEK